MMLFAMLPCAAAMQFYSFEVTEQYKCSSFLAEQVHDRAMTQFYWLINVFIRLLSKPFPHQDVLNKRALEGDISEIQHSLLTKYPEWLAHEQWWLLLSASVVLLSALFTICYLLYSCCIYSRNSKSKKTVTDSRYDPCKRHLLNSFIAIFTISNIFAVTALLISSQYAEYGADELPQRLGHCLDDLALYKRDTDMKIRKLLIDDLQVLNASLMNTLASGGSILVQRVKKVTGAQVIDVLVNISKTANEVHRYAIEVQKQMKILNEELSKFKSDFSKLRKTSTKDLLACVRDELEPAKSICQKAEKLLNEMDKFPLSIQGELISGETTKGLQHIINSNISGIFTDAVANFAEIEKELQAEIDQKHYSVQSKLKQIEDDLFAIAETISTQIRQISLNSLYKLLSAYTDEKSGYQDYVRYSWYGSLLLSGIFALIAFYFLFALCYGCCGRRPTYYGDECCVRTTGSKLFKCGIWLTVILLTFLAIATAGFLFIGANVANLICHPLTNPLARPDMLSLSERILELWRSKISQSSLSSYMDNRTPAEVIRACAHNNTLYQIFELNKRYHLTDLREHEKEAFDQLEDRLQLILSDIRIRRPLNTLITQEKIAALKSVRSIVLFPIAETDITLIKEEAKRLDLTAQAAPFVDELIQSNVMPRAAQAVVERIKIVEAASAKALRMRLEEILTKATKLNELLSNITLPGGNVVVKLHHAQALLSADIHKHFEEAAIGLTNVLKANVQEYLDHVRNSIISDTTSCVPLAEIVRGSRSAFCSQIVDPFNGVWISMLISLVCAMPIAVMGTMVIRLYKKMHAFPKYIVHEPSMDRNQMCAFTTDTYDAGNKQYAHTGSYDVFSEEFPPPYRRTRT